MADYFIGIDVAPSKGVAIAVVDHNGEAYLRKLAPVGEKAARRLVTLRQQVFTALSAYENVRAVVIELPFPPSYLMHSATAVCMEATQAACPGADVEGLTTGKWRQAALGAKSDPGKKLALAWASEWMGESVTDDDLAEALCMATLAKRRWEVGS